MTACQANSHQPQRGRRSRHAPAAGMLFALVALVYFITAKDFSDVNDAEAYYLLTKALVERGAVDVQPELTEVSRILYYQGSDGKLYTHFGIGFPIFAAPLYVAGHALGNLAQATSPRLAGVGQFLPRVMIALGCALVAAGTVALLYLLLVWLGLPSPWALGTALLYAFSTYAWAYSKLGFYDIHLVFFELAAIVGAVRYRVTGKLLWCVLAGLMLGWGIAIRPTLVLALVPLAVYMAWAGWQCWRQAQAQGSITGAVAAVLKPLIGFAVPLVPWLLVILWYNLQRGGGALDFGYPSGGYTAAPTPFRLLTGIYGNTFSTGRGFFLYSPVALLMFWGVKPLWAKRRAESILVWSIVLITGAFFCSRPGWYTQWPWGPRYLLVLAPLVMAAVGFALPRLWPKRAWRRVIVALIVISCLVQVLAIVVPYGTYVHHVEDVTGTWRSTIWNPRYFPILGQIHTLRRVSFDRVPLAALHGGRIPQEVKMDLRHSLDFWFIYAYRLGIPAAVWGALLAALLVAAVVVAQRLYALVKLSPPEDQGG